MPRAPRSSSASPPDRSRLLTEQRNPRAKNLHRLSVAQLTALIHREDAAVLAAVRTGLPALTRFIRAAERRFDPDAAAGHRLIYLGAGTSGRLGVLDASEAPPTFQVAPGRVVGLIAGGDRALRRSSEGREDDPDGARPDLQALRLTATDTVLAIAAGGTTPYALGGLAVAKRLTPRVLTGLLTCAPVKRPRDADHLIIVPTGPEVLTGSTRMKAGTATKMALNLVSTTLFIRAGRVHDNLMVDLRATNAKLRDRAARIVQTLTALPRPESLALLDAAGGSAKVAVVMHARACTRLVAQRRLARASGRLADAM